jgi:hypothetical protein
MSFKKKVQISTENFNISSLMIKVEEAGYKVVDKSQHVIEPVFPKKLLSGGSMLIVKDIQLVHEEKGLQIEVVYSSKLILFLYIGFIILGLVAQVPIASLILFPIFTTLILLIFIFVSLSEIKSDLKKYL